MSPWTVILAHCGSEAKPSSACADADEFMPQKTTYLFPKLPTGTVIHRLV
ncbi:MAG: hypothetical protein IIB38_12585 [Candidatus Hydrogenedentes bacterium]|nr:hypothetical protein [Candidatus Hydrogenedentota bacterium]